MFIIYTESFQYNKYI